MSRTVKIQDNNSDEVDLAKHEDILLAVSRLTSRNGKSPFAENIAALLHWDLPYVQDILNEISISGELLIEDDGSVKLTSSGENLATAVMRKHKVLETFFEEMLGMNRSAAHKQACTLEHHASEETINRLNRFIDVSLPQSASLKASKPPCFLADCNEGERVCIEARKRRQAG